MFKKGHKIFLGRKHSEETKQKMREKAIGRLHSQKAKNKLRKFRLGLKSSEETKKKMSLARLGSKNHFFGKKHSMKTRLKISSYRGDKKGNWKGGITPLRKKIRDTFEYRIWKNSVKERDNYTCIWCGSKENLEVDHIKPFAYFPELRFAIDNGRTLCRECHKTTDTYGKVQKM